MRWTLQLCALAAIGLLWVSLPNRATASLVVHYDFEQLVSQADGIVHAVVANQHAEWAGQTIVTTIELDVIECLKGPYGAGETVALQQAGGVVDDLAMRIAGAPEFRVGDEVVVFLEGGPQSGRPLVLGMSQGLFTVVPDADSGQPLVTRSLDGLSLVDPAALRLDPSLAGPDGAELTPVRIDDLLIRPDRLAADLTGIPLEDFLDGIRQVLASEVPGPMVPESQVPSLDAPAEGP